MMKIIRRVITMVTMPVLLNVETNESDDHPDQHPASIGQGSNSAKALIDTDIACCAIGSLPAPTTGISFTGVEARLSFGQRW